MKVTYNKQLTALLVINPYNDFISEGGKLWDRLKGVAEANHCTPVPLSPRLRSSTQSLLSEEA